MLCYLVCVTHVMPCRAYVADLLDIRTSAELIMILCMSAFFVDDVNLEATANVCCAFE